jgi:hypothetical protein
VVGRSEHAASERVADISWQGYLKGPRWMFGVETIYDYAGAYGLTVIAANEHKGLLTKTLTYTVRGQRKRVLSMRLALARAVEEHNATF